MAFVYIGPAVEAEFDDDDAWLLRLSGSFFFAGWIAGLGLWGAYLGLGLGLGLGLWIAGLGLWGETSHTLTLDIALTPWIAGLGLWGETSHTLSLDLALTLWIAGPRPLGLAQLSDPGPNPMP